MLRVPHFASVDSRTCCVRVGCINLMGHAVKKLFKSVVNNCLPQYQLKDGLGRSK